MTREPWTMLMGFMSQWHQAKLLVEHALTISHDTLHVFTGMIIWLLLAMDMRRPVTSWRPWLWTFVIILWNETVDLWTEVWPDPGQQYGEGLKDLALTMFVPTVLLAAARLRPDLFRQGLARRRRR
jgi:hypothetical protein